MISFSDLDAYMVGVVGRRSQFGNTKRYFALGSVFEEICAYSWDDLRAYYMAISTGQPMADDCLVFKGYLGCLVDFPCWVTSCWSYENRLVRWYVGRRARRFAEYRKKVVCYLLEQDYLNLTTEEQCRVVRRLCFRFWHCRVTMLSDIERFLSREGFAVMC